jgi:tetratricopeptide (TPR) repeat protein
VQFGKFAWPALAIALTCVICLQPARAAGLSVADQLARMQTQIVHFGPTMDTFDRLEKFIKDDDKNTQAHYVLGLALKKAGYGELSEEQFKLIQQTDPQFTRRVLDEFRTAIDKEDLLAAYEYTAFVRDVDPDNAHLMYLDALLLIGEDRYAEAAAKLSAAIRHDPALSGASSALGMIHLDKGNFSQAKQMALHDLRANPRHHQGNVVLGRALVGLHQYAEAEQPLKIAYETSGITPGSGRAYADDLIKLGRYQDALAPCLVDLACESKKLPLEQSKKVAETILPRISSDDISKAINQADAHLKGTSFEWRMYETLSDVFDRTGDYRNAAIVRTKGLLLEPNYTRGYFRMGQSLEQCHDCGHDNYRNAAKFYEKAYEHEPTNLDYLLSYRRCLERVRNRDNDLAWRLKDWLKRTMSPSFKPLSLDKPA